MNDSDNGKKKYRLNIELIPDACWYSNLRHIMKPADWDIIRRDAYSRADGKCMICSRPAKRLEAHEVWEFGNNGIQKLSDIIAICHLCHSVIHMARTSLAGNEDAAVKHFMKVNKCGYTDFIHAWNEANEVQKKLNLIPEWQLDVSWLSRFD
ncbi:MAG: hypothetical protein SOZ62_00905 [Eubacteriales bacterium]|nr:hypothetical protein [Eubacteriales bacterium]